MSKNIIDYSIFFSATINLTIYLNKILSLFSISGQGGLTVGIVDTDDFISKS